MGVDSGKRNTAVRMLRKTMPMTLLRVNQTGYDEATRRAILEEAPTNIHARVEKFALRDIGKAGIEAGDLKLTVAAKEAGDPKPSQGDAVVMDGERWGIQECDVVMGYREPILYVLRVRK